jgi:hypothetical protein
MPRTRIYESNAEKQRAFRERQKEKEASLKAKIDFSKPLESFVDYFKRMTNLEPSKEQLEIIGSFVEFNVNTIVCAGRHLGKSLISSVFALWCADELSRFLKHPVEVTLISSQSSIYELIDQIFLSHPELTQRLRVQGKSLEIPLKKFQFADTLGSVERIVPTSNQIRSHHSHVIIIDECSYIPENIIKTSFPLLKQEYGLGKFILISTPSDKPSLFNQYVDETPKGWELKQFTSEGCDWCKKMVDLCKNTMSQEDYCREVLAQIPTVKQRNFYGSKDIDKCIQSRVGFSGVNSTVHFGLDLGYNRSLTILTVCEWSGNYRNVIDQFEWHNENERMYNELPKIIRQYADKVTSKIVLQIDNKPTTLATEIKQSLKQQKIANLEIYLVDASEKPEGSLINNKDMMRNQLYEQIKSHRVKIPIEKDALIREIRNYTEGLQYGDDRHDSLLLAISNLPHKTEFHAVVVFGNMDKNDPFTKRRF